jgi:KDO2-lipid IV(A) lauroyltransferase
MWRHLFLLLCEIALAQRKIHHTNWRDYVHIHHAREIVSRMLSDRPLVVVTAHLGNFEMSGYIAGLLGLPTITIARDLDNVYLDRFLRRFRETTGQRIFSSKGTAELAQAVLESGGTLALLGDHHGGPKGCWVDFFGRPASCHKSVALFPLVNRLPLAVLVTTRVDRMLHFDMRCVSVWDPDRSCDAALQTVPELTQWYTYWIESAVKQAPDQYWWLHRRWKASASRTRKRN